jgi:hypothetical protein
VRTRTLVPHEAEDLDRKKAELGRGHGTDRLPRLTTLYAIAYGYYGS